MDGSRFSGLNTHRGSGNIVQIGNIAGNAFFRDPRNARKEFFCWLRPIDFRSDHSIILKKRYQQTGDWILQREEFNQWTNGHASSLLWCWGPPGIGKSVIASIVLNHLEKSIAREEKTTITYAYFKHDSQEQQTPAAIISSFIKQLCRNPEIPKFLLDFFEEFDNNLEDPSIDECS
ncbi:hypothetical protein B0J14DRAFT_114378 [Halenospora varia]|nr:hypothetical protein B0J14DRAFT_114378 [Halenospora varia]